jgi:hypothetical protein
MTVQIRVICTLVGRAVKAAHVGGAGIAPGTGRSVGWRVRSPRWHPAVAVPGRRLEAADVHTSVV